MCMRTYVRLCVSACVLCAPGSGKRDGRERGRGKEGRERNGRNGSNYVQQVAMDISVFLVLFLQTRSPHRNGKVTVVSSAGLLGTHVEYL